MCPLRRPLTLGRRKILILGSIQSPPMLVNYGIHSLLLRGTDWDFPFAGKEIKWNLKDPKISFHSAKSLSFDPSLKLKKTWIYKRDRCMKKVGLMSKNYTNTLKQEGNCNLMTNHDCFAERLCCINIIDFPNCMLCPTNSIMNTEHLSKFSALWKGTDGLLHRKRKD